MQSPNASSQDPCGEGPREVKESAQGHTARARSTAGAGEARPGYPQALAAVLGSGLRCSEDGSPEPDSQMWEEGNSASAGSRCAGRGPGWAGEDTASSHSPLPSTRRAGVRPLTPRWWSRLVHRTEPWDGRLRPTADAGRKMSPEALLAGPSPSSSWGRGVPPRQPRRLCPDSSGLCPPGRERLGLDLPTTPPLQERAWAVRSISPGRLLSSTTGPPRPPDPASLPGAGSTKVPSPPENLPQGSPSISTRPPRALDLDERELPSDASPNPHEGAACSSSAQRHSRSSCSFRALPGEAPSRTEPDPMRETRSSTPNPAGGTGVHAPEAPQVPQPTRHDHEGAVAAGPVSTTREDGELTLTALCLQKPQEGGERG